MEHLGYTNLAKAVERLTQQAGLRTVLQFKAHLGWYMEIYDRRDGSLLRKIGSPRDDADKRNAYLRTYKYIEQLLVERGRLTKDEIKKARAC